MFTLRTTTLVRAAAVAALLGFASLGTASIAAAERLSADDQEFIASLNAADIAFDKPAAAINVAHAVCADFADGASYGDLVDVTLSSTDLSGDQAEILVGESAWFYCPEFLAEIGS
jgi:hypothetical protein